MEKLALFIEQAINEKQKMELLMQKFTPLIRHLAHKLPYDYLDAEQDMFLSFLKLIHHINLNDIKNKEDKSLVKYIHKTMINCYIDLLHK